MDLYSSTLQLYILSLRKVGLLSPSTYPIQTYFFTTDVTLPFFELILKDQRGFTFHSKHCQIILRFEAVLFVNKKQWLYPTH